MLREQASILGELTEKLLEGRVIQLSPQSPEILTYSLTIIAPSLNNYSVGVVLISHKMTLYPVFLVNLAGGGKQSCGSEPEFEVALEKILGSEQVKKLVESLLAQIRSGSGN